MKSPKQSSNHTQSTKSLSWSVVDAQDYFDRLAADIDTAKHCIRIKTMTYKTGPSLARVETALREAAHRGVVVELHLDKYALIGMGLSSLNSLRKLQQSGVHVQWHGRIKLNPFSGRSHTKFAVIDSHVYAFGGMNFKESSGTHRDFMLYAQSKPLAAYLCNLNTHTRPVTHFPWGNAVYDSGKSHNSPILSSALQHASLSNSIIYVSKMAPDGQILKQIKRTKGKVLYNSVYSRRTSTMTKLAAFLAGRGTPPKNAYSAHQGYLHMKCLLMKAGDGLTTVVTGSHNFSSLGVRFGTEELALVTHDPELYKAIVSRLP